MTEDALQEARRYAEEHQKVTHTDSLRVCPACVLAAYVIDLVSEVERLQNVIDRRDR